MNVDKLLTGTIGQKILRVRPKLYADVNEKLGEEHYNYEDHYLDFGFIYYNFL